MFHHFPKSELGKLRLAQLNPDSALEILDERGTPTAKLCGAGAQKIRNLYSKFVAAQRYGYRG